MALWGKKIKAEIRQADALKVLEDLGAEDKNPGRGLTNCPWLKSKGGVIGINPAAITDARNFAKKFCMKSWEKSE